MEDNGALITLCGITLTMVLALGGSVPGMWLGITVGTVGAITWAAGAARRRRNAFMGGELALRQLQGPDDEPGQWPLQPRDGWRR